MRNAGREGGAAYHLAHPFNDPTPNSFLYDIFIFILTLHFILKLPIFTESSSHLVLMTKNDWNVEIMNILFNP